MALGCQQPDELSITLSHVMNAIIQVGSINHPDVAALLNRCEYMQYAQGMDFIPSSIELTAIENSRINTMSRESILHKLVSQIKDGYDFVLLDCLCA